MYLHLGQDTVVRGDEIIGIFDLDNTTVSKHTRTFLRNQERRGKVVTITDDLPKSFVLCGRGEYKIYLSQISAATLKKRNK